MRTNLISKNRNLEGIYEHLVATIDNALKRETVRINPVLDHDICCCYTQEILRKSPSTESVLEISQNDWVKTFGRSRMRDPAVYLPSDGKIYLQTYEWCLCNFTHETLHSRSILSKKNGPYVNLKFVCEGITELLTVWFLQIESKECFASWSNIETCFLKSYQTWVKMWNYFSSKIGIEGLIDLYFDCNCADPLHALINLAIKKGHKIHNVFSPYDSNTDLESKFWTELSDSFGTDFDEYMYSNIRFLEPGKV